MRTIESKLERQQFFARLLAHGSGVLLLDYDGTLAPFHVDRYSAFPYAGVARLLNTIIATGRTRVVLISGRPVQEVQSLLGVVPSPEIWGLHGQQRLRLDGSCQTVVPSEAEKELLKEAGFRIEAKGLGHQIESKPGSIAVHWRGLSATEGERVQQIVCCAWQPFGSGGKASLLEFDGGMELRLSGKDKGSAVLTIRDEVATGTPVAYLGDDTTDEDAFAALRGKETLTVLVRPEWRETRADIWIKPPQELLQFLEEWLQCSGGAG